MLYPIGIQDFESIRRNGYVYVDKTALIYRLATTGRYYFLSRPRRFGKSLLVSMMEAYFSGKKDLFEGLAVSGMEKDWTVYPVLRFDLSGEDYSRPDVLDAVLSRCLKKWEDLYGVPERSSTLSSRFKDVIEAAVAKTGRPAVVLIDEYDKPIVDTLWDENLSETVRVQLQGFYGVMKAMDGSIRFGFLTGVSKLGKLSVFSGLNNLKDISMDARYSDICGISEKELRKNFADSVKELAHANGLTEKECFAKLTEMYDGYHFCEKSEGVYNPFSLLNTLDSLHFRKYWVSTGTPSFLVKSLIQGNYRLAEMESLQVPESVLSGVYSRKPDVISLLYQTGYLTIVGYNPATERYTLGYPNKEVEDGFTDTLSEYFTPVRDNWSELSADKFVEDIRRGDVQMLMRRFTAFFADMDYRIQGKAELYFQNTMYVMLKLLGQQVAVERHTSNGRIDILVQTDRYVYIIELKRDRDPQDALDQIDEKGYDWPFLAGDRKVFKIGASFSSATRRLENWSVAE